MSDLSSLEALLTGSSAVVLVEIREVMGSTPREAATWMLVSEAEACGTIGGGQLEFMAIDHARAMIAGAEPLSDMLDIPLGPEIGQCCGGRVKIDFALMDADLKVAVRDRIASELAGRPEVYLFGGGHVGRALAAALSLLPVRTVVVETRPAALESMPAGVETRLTPVPEDVVASASIGSAFVVVTHDHALDFLIVAEALKRDDAAFIGMIGSETKKATFASWYRKTIGEDAADPERVTTPIGGGELRDKRPAVIAALAAAEILVALSKGRVPAEPVRETTSSRH